MCLWKVCLEKGQDVGDKLARGMEHVSSHCLEEHKACQMEGEWGIQ